MVLQLLHVTFNLLCGGSCPNITNVPPLVFCIKKSLFLVLSFKAGASKHQGILAQFITMWEKAGLTEARNLGTQKENWG